MNTEPIPVGHDGPVGRRIATLLEEDRRRAAISILAEAPGPVPEAVLARAVAVQTDDEPAAVDDDAIRAVRIELHHCDLPKLADAGIVDRDAGGGAIDLTDHGSELAREIQDADDDAWSTIAASGRRERASILRTLATLDAPVGLPSLADALVDDHETWEDPRAAAVRLHHVDLPRLDDAGFLSYDAVDRRIEIQ